MKVQIQVEACNGVRSPPTCICGIAVRAGRDVFLINSCGGINYLGYSSCEDHGIIDVIEVGTRNYKIFTPIGTQIDVAMPRFSSKVLNVDIFMSPKDEYNVEGHCGKFDGNDTNDFTHRNGGLTANQRTRWQSPTQFSDSWRLSAEENLFLRPGRELETWDEINKNYCVCKRSGSNFGTQCSPSQSLGCFDSKSLAKRKCRLLTARRRSTSKGADMELRRLFATFSQHQPRTERKRRAVSHNISADEATKLCAELNQSIPLTDLADVSANESAGAVTFQCEYDVVAMNDPSFVSVHTDAMNSVVKTILDLTPSYVTNNSQKVEYFIANSCLKNCSDHGVCTTNGTCSCNGSYRGTDCSIDITQPLTIDDIEGGGACDIAEGDDCHCFTLRTDDLLDNFHCAIDVFKVSSKTDTEKIWSGSNQGEYEDLFTGVCCVNDEHISGRTSSFALKYGFAISNNGVNYGTYVKTYVYDSTCQEAQSTSNGDTVISMKDSFCFIDGACVENGQKHTSNSCIVCQTDNDVYNWTQVVECGGIDDNSNSRVLIIAATTATVVGLLAIGITVVLVWKLCQQKKVKPNSQLEEYSKGVPKFLERPAVAKTAWSRFSYFSKDFNQREKNPFALHPEKPSINKGLKWADMSVPSNRLVSTNEASISPTGFDKRKLKIERQATNTSTSGPSVIDLDFD